MNANNTVSIFGYGSLMSVESLLSTVPDATNIRPAYIVGFKREFNLWDTEGWTVTNLDVGHIPYCAVNIAVSDSDSRVNGVLFDMSVEYYEALQQREVDYELVTTDAYDFNTKQLIGECSVFMSAKRNGSYDFDNVAQTRYLEVCANGAKEYGAEFYNKFMSTTLIDGRPLSNVFEFR